MQILQPPFVQQDPLQRCEEKLQLHVQCCLSSAADADANANANADSDADADSDNAVPPARDARLQLGPFCLSFQ